MSSESDCDSPQRISLLVAHRGITHTLSLLPTSTLSSLQFKLEQLTSVPPELQKLLYGGKKKLATTQQESRSASSTLIQAGLKDGMKVQMLGSTARELEEMKVAEDEQKKRDRILRERALKPSAKVRSTASSNIASAYTFHRLEPLQHLPNPASALSLLERLSNDPAIVHIMQQHRFSVGLLTELAPHESPELLGLNVNSGEAIKLRLRTDGLDGFRFYTDVRRVLCHELAHNVWGEHDNNFKELNSRLNRQVTEFERNVRGGMNYLVQGDFYEPSSELEAEAHVHILGGSGDGGGFANESREERRRRVLEATMNRLRKQEEELEESCGTSASARRTG